MLKFNADLNHFYKKHSEFYEIEDSWSGFDWMNANDADHNIYSYICLHLHHHYNLILVNIYYLL